MTYYFSSFCASLALCLLLTVSTNAQASSIFTNMDTSHSYDINHGWVIGDGYRDGSTNLTQASAFVANASASLGHLVLALSNMSGTGQIAPVTVSLQADRSNTPGMVLESFNIAPGTLLNLGNSNPVLVLNSLIQPLLVSRTQYWVSISTNIANTIVWNFNNTNALDTMASQSLDGGVTWYTPSGSLQGALEVDPYVQNVPEPSPVALLAGGLLAACIRLYLRRKN
jgi:hypothetical protein